MRLTMIFAVAAGSTVLWLGSVSPAAAVNITGVLPMAIDQPQVIAVLRRSETGDPLTGTDIFGSQVTAISGFYDTGASGVILSPQTADSLGVNRLEQPAGNLIVFEDVGVGGSAAFNVSEPLFIDLAPGSPTTDPSDPRVFTQRFGPINAQVGPLNTPDFPDGIDVFGMPTMAGKVIVMDSRNVRLPTIDDILGDPANFPGLRTYTYDPGTPFRPETGQTDPGIPDTNLHVPLSYSTFDDFTKVNPTGAQGPTLNRNPFIGPAPVPESGSGADDTPAVTLGFGAEQVSGSLLLDTGAAASFISSELAAGLNVRVVPGTEGTDNPQLELFDPTDGSSLGLLDDQFTTTVTGVGGTETLAGFLLDSLLVKTLEGDVLIDADPAHLRYLDAPVFINDIGLMNPVTGEELILDGVFGMNYLTTSADIVLDPITGLPISIVEGKSPFPWVTFDEPNGILGVTASVIPIPAAGWLLLSALTALGAAARRRSSTCSSG